jgi:hypothetical protein
MEYELPRNFHNIPYYSKYKNKKIPDSLGIANMFARKILYREQQIMEGEGRESGCAYNTESTSHYLQDSSFQL